MQSTRSFWGILNKPIFALAPMADVTDAAFRFIIAKYGKPDVMFTEFVSSDGLCSDGKDRLLKDLQYSEIERPIVAQIFGKNPDHFYQSALLLCELGFDGIDINMGCPERKIIKQGAGAALIQETELAKKIIIETKRGASSLPVSIKTRIGFNTIEVESWISCLLETEPAALTVHGRTKKEMSHVPAHWDEIAKAAALRDRMDSDALILGNGDVRDIHEAQQKVQEYGVDGVMIGRAIFGNPWLFSRKESSQGAHTPEEKLSILREHTRLFDEYFHDIKNFSIMKKHFKAYVNGFSVAKELRIRLMEAKDAETTIQIMEECVTHLFNTDKVKYSN